MLEKIFDPILAPFRWLRSTVFNVKMAPTRVKGEIMRAQGQIQTVKGDFQSYKQDVQSVQKGAGQLQQRFGPPGQPGQPGQPMQQGQPGQPMQQGQPGGWGGQPPPGNQMGGGGGWGGGAPPQAGGWGGGAPAQGAQGAQGGGAWGGAPAGAPMQGGMGGTAPQAAPPPKMGFFARLFGRKKACPSCGQKLHPSWPECPYCGWGRQQAQPQLMAPMPSGAKGRTMALDLNAPMPVMPGSDGLVGWMIPLEGRHVGELMQVKGRSVIGKSPECNIIIDEPSISGRHAEFVPTSNGFRLNDLGSTNGTWVNDKRVTTHDLVDNDNVRLGRLNFKYKSTLG